MPENKKLLRWPSWMPKPQRSGYKYDVIDRRKKTDMEVGAVIRVEFDTDECTCDCTLVLNKIQSAWFEAFERDIMHQGAQWFEIPLQNGGVISMHTARFRTRPSLSDPGPMYSTYQFTLDIDRRPQTICPQLVEFLLCVSPNDLCRTASTLREAMQEVVPSIDLPDFWVPRQTSNVLEVA